MQVAIQAAMQVEKIFLNLRVRDWLPPDAVMAWSSAHFGDD